MQTSPFSDRASTGTIHSSSRSPGLWLVCSGIVAAFSLLALVLSLPALR
jgi:hypothetical protein